MRKLSLKAIVLSLFITSWSGHAATFKEAGGVVVIEAVHFDSRFDQPGGPHIWTIVPDEATGVNPLFSDGRFAHSRTGSYMQILPDAGQNRNNGTDDTSPDYFESGPYLEYKLQITTTGEYQLYLRDTGFDGGSDSCYAEIIELRKDAVPAGPGPDWYRYTIDPTTATGDFSTILNNIDDATSTAGWAGYSTPEINDGGAAGDRVPTLWTISKAGTYTLRIKQREDGNAMDALILQLSSKPVPADPGPDESACDDCLLISQQPKDVSVGVGATASFIVKATSSGATAYQWQKAAPGSSAFADIAGATSATFTTAALNPADSGTQYRVNLSIPGKSATSRAATATIDNTPPTVVKASGNDNFNRVTVTFSEPVTAATGGNQANYSLSGGLTISEVTLSSDGRSAVLKTSQQSSGTSYTLTVKDIRDLVTPANVISPNPTQISFTGAVLVPGAVGFETWLGITGTAVDGLTSDARYPDNPDFFATATGLDTRSVYPTDAHENYGGRLRTFLIPDDSVSYELFLRSDDASQLFLSSDDSFANVVQIAEETACCNAFMESGAAQTSTPIPLVKGKKYALQVLWKEGGGGDYAQVAWRKEGDTTAAANLQPIRGNVLSWYASPDVKLDITQDPQNQTVVAGEPVTFSVRYVADSTQGTNASVQWQKNGADIPGATDQDYSIQFVDPADNGAKFHAVVSISTLASKTSADATLTVTPDTAPPQIVSVAAVALDAIVVSFNERVEKTSAETASNYAVVPGVTVNSAVLDPALTIVRVTTSALIPNQQYTLTVGGVKDFFGNAMAAGAKAQFSSTFFSYADIILADKPIAFYRFDETSGSIAKNSGSTGGDGQYSKGNETVAMEGGAPGTAKGDPGPRPPAFVGFALDNHAATFNGVDDWVDTKNQFLQNRAAFTLEYWVKPVGRAGWATRIGIVGQNDAIEYGFIDPNTIQIWTPGGGSLNTAYSFPDGEWHHIATIADGTNLKNYYDGVLVGTGGTPTTDPDTGYGGASFNVHIGGAGVFDGTGNWFTGGIDEVAIFDKAIPAERIAAHYKAGKLGGNTEQPTSKFTGISLQGPNVIFTWNGTGTLQSADAVTGPYADVTGATSPRTVPVTNGPKYYRFKP